MIIFNLLAAITVWGAITSGSPYPPANTSLNITNNSSSIELSSTAASKKKPIDVFVIEGCVYCQQLEEFLQTKEIEYRRYDIQKDKEGYTLYKKLGGGGLPLVRIGRQIFHGFDPMVVISAYKYGY